MHDNAGLAVVNNLLSGPPMRVETESPVRRAGNLTVDAAGWFVDVARGDLHLSNEPPEAARRADRIGPVAEDFDCQPRRPLTDVGADQRRGAMRTVRALALTLALLPIPSTADWVEPMRRVHARFTGQPGTFAQFGDSITDSRAFWFSLKWKREDASPEMLADFELVQGHMLDDCWDRKGPEYGNQGGQTTRWAAKNLDRWLRQWNPEAAILMFGTNDLNNVGVEDYEATLEDVVERCLDHGTVVILSTIPPRHGREEKAARFAEAARRVAERLQVPLVDFHAEILRRRPDDWDGAQDQFREYQGYDVPTLIARDGVHPSNPKQYAGHYSEAALSTNGFSLRNCLVLRKYAEVIRKVLRPE